MTAYRALRPFRSETVRLRDIDHHVLVWDGAAAPHACTGPLLVLCHGWMDVAASFQFLVDALPPGLRIIAPDWRGFGATLPWAGADHFVFADYLLDLDYLLDHFAGDQPVDLLGHSMGGNIALQYAGLRPQRIRRLINLEGFGLPDTTPDQAPQRLQQWMDQVRALRAGALGLRAYPDLDAVAVRLQQNNPRLPDDRARWLARHWAEPQADGQWHIRAHPAHKIANQQLYHAEEVMAVLRGIRAPTLCITARDDTMPAIWGQRYGRDAYLQRMSCIADVRHATVNHAGHMLHHDQPQALAALIAPFLQS